MKYVDLLLDLGINLVCILVLAGLLYYRRHRRSELLLAYIAINIGLFITMVMLSSVRVDLALGFGLFAILSIIQVRSNTMKPEEVAYYFASLVLGLVNGLRLHDRGMTLMLDAALLLVMFLVDHRRKFARSTRIEVVLDVVHDNRAALVADLERRLHGDIEHYILESVDYVRETMVIDVRYRPWDRAGRTPESEAGDGHHTHDQEVPNPSGAR